MANVLVRNIPEKVHETLLRRASERGQSLQQYLTDQLTRLAVTPTQDEVLARIAARTGGRVGLEQAAADLAEIRGER